jgi:hypothetical protein
VSWFDRFRRQQRGAVPGPTSEGLADLRSFMEERDGVEAFIEPPTPVYAMSLCLVAADGEYIRRSVKDAKQANQMASKHGVPVYDARIVGYPRRMRDYDRGLRSRGVSLEDLPPLETADEPDDRD